MATKTRKNIPCEKPICDAAEEAGRTCKDCGLQSAVGRGALGQVYCRPGVRIVKGSTRACKGFQTVAVNLPVAEPSK